MNKYKKQFSIVAGGFCNDYKDKYIKYLEFELSIRDERVQELEASEDASNCILDVVSKDERSESELLIDFANKLLKILREDRKGVEQVVDMYLKGNL